MVGVGCRAGAGAAAGLFQGPKIQAPAPSSAIAAMPPAYASARDFLWPVTVTAAVALAPSQVQVIVAAPGWSAVTRPSSETVATSWSVVAHVMMRPTSVAPLARLGRAVSCTAPPTATVTWAGDSAKPTTPAEVVLAACSPTPLRGLEDWLFPTGEGLAGVLNFASSCEVPPCVASVIICVRTGSSGASVAFPNAATAASTFGQRFAGSFSSIRITALAISGGQSARFDSIGAGGSLKCAYMIAMTVSAVNGKRPASISYATIPSEY